MKNIITIKVFRYKNRQVYQIYGSNKSFKNYMGLLLLGIENKCLQQIL